MKPSKLRKLKAHLAQFGVAYTGPRCEPTRDGLYQRQPQLCRECGNGSAGRELLPAKEGHFLTDHNGIRWVCHRCIRRFKLPVPAPVIYSGYNTNPR